MNYFKNWYTLIGIGVFALMMYGAYLGKQVAQGKRRKDAFYWIVIVCKWLVMIGIVAVFIFNSFCGFKAG